MIMNMIMIMKHEVASSCMRLHRVACSCIELHRVACSCIELHRDVTRRDRHCRSASQRQEYDRRNKISRDIPSFNFTPFSGSSRAPSGSFNKPSPVGEGGPPLRWMRCYEVRITRRWPKRQLTPHPLRYAQHLLPQEKAFERSLFTKSSLYKKAAPKIGAALAIFIRRCSYRLWCSRRRQSTNSSPWI